MDRVAFLEHLRQSRLLSGEQVDALATRYGAETPQCIAATLIEEGVLTRYQAKQIWAGKSRGLVLGQYRILDELGKGGFGQVFKARHTLMDRIVALKVISPELLEDSRARSWFQREVLASTQLCHPNIVMAYDANEVDDILFLVMEYVAGPNLDTFVKDQGPLPIGLACETMRQAALGLQHAHEKGMVHRDIKPGNLLLPEAAWGASPAGDGLDAPRPGSPVPLVKVVDFGLARLHRTATAGTLMLQNERSFLGTPDYVSPEQARNLHAVDIRSDLYSLGCTFYFALSARRPFRGTTVLEVVVKHLEKEPEPLEDVRPDVPAGVCAVIRRLMAKDPQQRFQTPGELVAALAPWCGAEAEALVLCAAASTVDRAAAPAWPRGTESATALVPDLAFWQGPERQRPAEKKLRVPPDRPTPVPAALPARADEALNLPATAMVLMPAAAQALGEAAPAADDSWVTAISEANDPAAEAQPAGERQDEAPAPQPYHASAAFRKGWRQWVSVVEVFVQGGNARINESAYRTLRSALLEHCRAPAGAARPAVLAQVESLLEPWVAPRAFAATDRETLGSLLERCRQVSRDFGLSEHVVSWRWLGVLFFLALAVLGFWYMERARNALAAAVPAWGVRLRALVTAHPVPSLAAAATAVIPVSIFLLSRLLRK